MIQQVLPDDSTISSAYMVSSDGTRLVERTTDPLGQREERESRRPGEHHQGGSSQQGQARVLMSATYSYDGLSQILSAVDSRGNAVAVAYDLLGRRTSLQSPDAGIVDHEL